MAFDKTYYSDKFQDKIKERGKLITRLIADIYSFVKDNEEVITEINKIDAIIKAEEAKSSPDNQTKIPPKNDKQGDTK
jgi:hypothetical protein